MMMIIIGTSGKLYGISDHNALYIFEFIPFAIQSNMNILLRMLFVVIIFIDLIVLVERNSLIVKKIRIIAKVTPQTVKVNNQGV